MNLKYLKHLAKKSEPFIHPGGYAATQLLINKLGIKPGDKILEIGCGTGATLLEIAEKFDCSLCGVDILDEMIASASQRIKNAGLDNEIKIIKTGLNAEFPFETNSFDKVYMESVIGFQRIETMRSLLNEITRILKSGGLYAANEALWKDNIPDETVKRVCDSQEKNFGLSHASPDNITIAKFTALAQDAGFEILETIPLRGIEDDKIDTGVTKNNSTNTYSLLKIPNEIIYKLKLKKHTRESILISGYLTVMRKV